MAKRTSGGRLTAAQRRKRREKSRGKDSLLRMPGNVAKYYRDNPGMLAEDIAVGIPGLSGIAIGRKAARGDSADAALSAAGLVPGVGAVGKGAKLASVASKASRQRKPRKLLALPPSRRRRRRQPRKRQRLRRQPRRLLSQSSHTRRRRRVGFSNLGKFPRTLRIFPPQVGQARCPQEAPVYD